MAMKLQLAARSRSYELTYLVPAAYTDSELAKITEGLEAKIKKQGGKISTTEKWGKKKLSYKIKHASKNYTEAFYFFVVFEADPAVAQEIERTIYLNTQLLRHLLVVAEPVKAVKAAKPAAAKPEPAAEEKPEKKEKVSKKASAQD
jgi:small subunit ribosomal protein S6